MMMKDKLNEILRKTAEDNGSPKVTIALPTHRLTSESKKDQILYGNLLKDVKSRLEEGFDKEKWESTYIELEGLKNDLHFWEHASDGLLILATDGIVEKFMLNYTINPHVVVSDTFHIQPLFIKNHEVENYYLADLGKDRVNLYEVNANELKEFKPEDIKLNFDELFSDTDSNYNYNTTTYAGVGNTAHGHRDKSEEEDKYREKFYRYLDKEFKALNSSSGYGFILSGTVDNVATFRQFTQEKFYHDETIGKPMVSLNKTEILDEVRKVLIPDAEKVLEGIKQEIDTAKGSGKFVSDCVAIKKAVEEGRIAKLIIVEEGLTDMCSKIDEVVKEAYDKGSEICVLKKKNDLEANLMAILRF